MMKKDCWCNFVGKKMIVADDINLWHCSECHRDLVPEDYPHTCSTSANRTSCYSKEPCACGREGSLDHEDFCEGGKPWL